MPDSAPYHGKTFQSDDLHTSPPRVLEDMSLNSLSKKTTEFSKASKVYLPIFRDTFAPRLPCGLTTQTGGLGSKRPPFWGNFNFQQVRMERCFMNHCVAIHHAYHKLSGDWLFISTRYHSNESICVGTTIHAELSCNLNFYLTRTSIYRNKLNQLAKSERCFVID